MKREMLSVTIHCSATVSDTHLDVYKRQVFIVAKPAQNIDRLAIDAKADGNFYADCFLNMAVEGARVHTVITDAKGKKVAENTSDVRTGSDHASINFAVKSPELWTAETPAMYQATFKMCIRDRYGRWWIL